jgi:hypothetical protein
MEALTFFNCKDFIAAKTKEQEYFVALKATLNSVEPLGNKKIKEEGDGKEKKKKVKENIVIENKIKDIKDKEATDTQLKHCCKLCKYTTSRLSQYERHLKTTKHKKRKIKPYLNNVIEEATPKNSNIKYICNHCAKEYKDRSGLWKHNKVCIKDGMQQNNIDEKNLIENLQIENTEFKKISLDLLKSNTDMQKLLAEVINKIT